MQETQLGDCPFQVSKKRAPCSKFLRRILLWPRPSSGAGGLRDGWSGAWRSRRALGETGRPLHRSSIGALGIGAGFQSQRLRHPRAATTRTANTMMVRTIIEEISIMPSKGIGSISVVQLLLHEARRTNDRDSSGTDQSNQQSGEHKLFLHGVAFHECRALGICRPATAVCTKSAN